MAVAPSEFRETVDEYFSQQFPSDEPGGAILIMKDDSIIFSKGYGLAGLRFGYAIGDPAVIAQMAKVKDSYNCDAMAIAAACAALDDVEYARTNWRAIRAERERLSVELGRRRFAVIPSQANFLLATTPDAAHAGWLYTALKVRGVLVRFFDKPALDNKLRISVGAPEENDALLAAVDAAFVQEPSRNTRSTTA